MFSRPAVAIAIIYAIIIILFRPMIPVPDRPKYSPEQPDIPIVTPISQCFSEVIRKTLPPPYDALLGSVVFGTNFSPLDVELKDAYKKVGLAHLLVASGTQVSILIGTSLAVARFFKMPTGISVFIISIINLLFAAMTGFGASIIRAAVMGQIALLGKLFNRDPEIYTSLSISALFLMILDPLVIFNIGFQLTFAATWALVYLCPILEEKGIPSIIALSLSPIMATLLITLFNFNQLSIVALPVNLLVIPWVEFLTIAGFVSTLFGAIFLPIAFAINFSLLIILKLLNGIVYTFSGLSFACIYLKQPTIILFLAYYVGLIWFAEYLKGTIMIKLTRKNVIFLTVAFIALFIWNAALAPSSGFGNNNLQISVIDVGQGDSIFIKSPTGKTMLIDGGAKARNFDAGKKRVIPFLHKQGINRLDYVVLTHPHNDHVGGLPAVLREMPVGEVIDSGQVTTTKAYMDFLKLIDQKKIKYTLGRAGQEIDLGSGVKGQVLNPQEPFLEESALNNNSVVIWLTYGKFSMMLMGDAEREAEERISGYRDIGSSGTILKVGHHGSRTASSQEFLDAIQPKVAIISVGANNVYHHPHMSTMKRLEDVGAKVYRTDLNGTVSVNTDGIKYEISTN